MRIAESCACGGDIELEATVGAGYTMTAAELIEVITDWRETHHCIPKAFKTTPPDQAAGVNTTAGNSELDGQANNSNIVPNIGFRRGITPPINPGP